MKKDLMALSKYSNKKFLLLLFLTTSILISIIYANSLTDEFAFDDDVLIVKNSGIKDIADIRSVIVNSLRIPQRPVTSLSFAIDYHFWGLFPEGYHISNIIYYILSCIAFTALVHLIFDKRLITVLFAIFFSTHPVHTETVSSLLGRSELLSATFLAYSFISYLHAGKNNGKARILFYSLSAGSYLLSMLSKETGIVLIGLIILYEYCFKKEFKPYESLSPFLLFFICAVFYIAYWRYSTHSSVSNFSYFGGSFLNTFLMMFKVIAEYTLLLFFPIKLCAWYNILPINSFLELQFLISLVVVITILFFFFLSYRYSKQIFFFFLWALLSFIPISNLIPIPGHAMMAERWVYCTSVAFCVILAVSIEKVYLKGAFYLFYLWISLAIMIFYCIRTVDRNPVFKNNITIYSDINICCPELGPAHTFLGAVLADEGKYYLAISEINQALKIDPNYHLSHYHLGRIYMFQGKIQKALSELIKATKYNPEQSEYRYWLASAYKRIGENKKALTEYKEFLKLSPKDDPRVENIKLLTEKILNGK